MSIMICDEFPFRESHLKILNQTETKETISKA